MADPFEKRWGGIGVGGTPALDFANTLDWRGRAEPVEMLRDYGALLRWAWSAELLDPGATRDLLRWSEAHPRMARRALDEAIESREAIAAVFQAVARGVAVPAGPLARLEADCRAAWGGRVLAAGPRGAGWGWRAGAPEPERPRWAVALDAERLLTSDTVVRVRECGDTSCGWLFLDTSRNRSRRWCSMEGCGNRNKARSFYRRSAVGKGAGRR